MVCNSGLVCAGRHDLRYNLITVNLDINSLRTIGDNLGRALRGGECIELIGDVGTGKTTLTKAIAQGLEIDDDVQSPSFTISRQYEARDGLRLVHYDFYRLSDPGLMSYELSEALQDPKVITVIEWAETVQAVLPDERIQIWLSYAADGLAREMKYRIPQEGKYLEAAL